MVTELKSNVKRCSSISVDYEEFTGPRPKLCCINTGYDSINENTTDWSITWTVTAIDHETPYRLTGSSDVGSIHCCQPIREGVCYRLELVTCTKLSHETAIDSRYNYYLVYMAVAVTMRWSAQSRQYTVKPTPSL